MEQENGVLFLEVPVDGDGDVHILSDEEEYEPSKHDEVSQQEDPSEDPYEHVGQLGSPTNSQAIPPLSGSEEIQVETETDQNLRMLKRDFDVLEAHVHWLHGNQERETKRIRLLEDEVKNLKDTVKETKQSIGSKLWRKVVVGATHCKVAIHGFLGWAARVEPAEKEVIIVGHGPGRTSKIKVVRQQLQEGNRVYAG
ncbi:hypothetical protein L1887_17734 [Cichorium endivia]|nr:hypothetical protein L1887_17734 [Cichorium endivia]